MNLLERLESAANTLEEIRPHMRKNGEQKLQLVIKDLHDLFDDVVEGDAIVANQEKDDPVAELRTQFECFMLKMDEVLSCVRPRIKPTAKAADPETAAEGA